MGDAASSLGASAEVSAFEDSSVAIACGIDKLSFRRDNERNFKKAYLGFLLLLLLLGTLRSLHLFLCLVFPILETSQDFGQDTRALGSIFLLGLSFSLKANQKKSDN